MRKMSKIQGYTVAQIDRFNKMLELQTEDIPPEELAEFKQFYKLAEQDEVRRIKAMRGKKLTDYSPQEKSWFNQMHEMLTDYNRALDTDKIIDIPDFSDIEMWEYSKYRELLIASESE